MLNAVALGFVTLSVAAAGSLPTLKASFKVKNPAVAALSPHLAGTEGPALLITTFNAPLAKDPVYAVGNLAGIVAGQAANITTLDKTMKWVNFVAPVPDGAVGNSTGRDLVLAAGGFLVPTKSPGSVNLLDVTDPSAVANTKLSTDKSGYFYHDAVWADINKDGRLDVLTARATQPLLFGKKAGELVWFEQPAEGVMQGGGKDGAWAEHVVCPGPDVAFIFEDLDGDGLEEVLATQFFSSPELRVYWCTGKASWAECGADDISSRVVDGAADGPWFNLERVDLDMDGKKELLATSNRDDGEGALFAFEIPDDFRTANWTSHKLSTGYKPAKSGTGKGAPGTAVTFHAHTADEGSAKPQILLSGDDAGYVDVLTAKSDAVGDFEYIVERLTTSESSGTIGTPAVGDVTGDGITEIFVPMYSDGRIEIYSFGA